MNCDPLICAGPSDGNRGLVDGQFGYKCKSVWREGGGRHDRL